MKQNLLMYVVALLVGWVAYSMISPSGKYQVVQINDPRDWKAHTYLLDTGTGRISELVYGVSRHLYWGPPEALNEREYDRRYPLKTP